MRMRKKVPALNVIWLIGIMHASTGQAAGDVLLTGSVTSASGENMEGVTVSARQFGKTFTTSVFTDADGEYYFPRLEEGKYKIWAQAVGYEAAILEDVSLNESVHQQELALKPMQNFELQLRGDEWMASLPENTREDVKMKEVFRMTCFGGCHSPSHALKDRYDERSWKVILDMMMRQSSVGIYSIDEDRNVMPLLHYWKDELAAWLAKVRGPVPYPLEFKPRPRPTPVAEQPPGGSVRDAVRAETPPPPCRRMVRHDSIKWTCACGASGPVGRSVDGMPYVNSVILEHVTGETKIKVA